MRLIQRLTPSNLSNLLLILVISWFAYQRAPVLLDLYQRQGQKALPLAIQTLDGRPLALPLQQKHLLVFWATWCGPCKIELARINNLIKAGSISATDVIAISSFEERSTVENFIQKNDYKFIVALDPDGLFARQYKVAGTPTLYLVDENDKIEWASTGISPSLELRLKLFF